MADIRLIERDLYLEQLEHTKQTPDVKVITGVRRSGKSKLLGMFIKKIQSSEKNANVIHVDFNLLKFEPFWSIISCTILSKTHIRMGKTIML